MVESCAQRNGAQKRLGSSGVWLHAGCEGVDMGRVAGRKKEKSELLNQEIIARACRR